jgi:hypothetical protein
LTSSIRPKAGDSRPLRDLRFAVHGPGCPVASPRSHRMPCGDISGRVHIGIAGVSAGRAPEDGLTLARLPVHVPAGAAALACERGIDYLDPAVSLVVQAPDKHPPPGREDLPVEPSFLTHVPAGIAESACCRPSHACDAQVLDADHIEPAGQIRADLFTPVLTSISLPGIEPGESEPCLGAAVATGLRAAQSASQEVMAPQPRSARPRNAQQFASGQRSAHCNAAIYPNNSIRSRACDGLGDRSERYMPSASVVQRDPERLHTTRDGAGPAEPDPAAFWDEHFPGSPVQSPDALRIQRYDAKPFATSSSAPRRSAVRASEEVLHGLGEIAECLLLHHLATGRQPSMLTPCSSQLPALLQVARRTPPPGTPPGLLFAGEVPDEPRMGAVFPQNFLLGIGRQQAIAGHTKTLSITPDNLEEVKRRFLTLVKVGAATPRIG